jgi:ankyrin repeat protein
VDGPLAGNNLLMLAAYHGKAELVRFLLSRGAQPDRLNDRGQSALSGAVFKGWTEIVKALVEAGADLRAGKPNAIDCAYMYVFVFTGARSLIKERKKSFRLLVRKKKLDHVSHSSPPLERFKRDDYWELLGASAAEISSDVPARIH